MRIKPLALAGMAAMALPIGVMINEHVSWETTPQAKKRMLTHQLTFWGMLGAGLVMMHRAFFAKLSTPIRAGLALAAGLVVSPAFKAGEILSQKLFPDNQASVPAPAAIQPPQPVQSAIAPPLPPLPVLHDIPATASPDSSGGYGGYYRQ